MNILRDYKLIPLEEGENYIQILCPEGFDLTIIEEIRFLKVKEIFLKIVSPDEFSQQLQKKLSEENIEIVEQSSDEKNTKDILLDDEKSPAVSFVNSILIKASALNASDIHLEPYENQAHVRFRLDGMLHTYNTIPMSLYETVVSRIKILSNLDVAEKKIPQDGKIRVKIGTKDIDLRVSVIPSTFGERVVLRLLQKSEKILSMEELGLEDSDLKRVKRLSQKPYGIILATGPTGSGKSTTLYSMILNIKSPHKNIITIEDPPEYQIEGVSQIQVNPKVGLTFASGLRSILRQDPDIIMVGEIRDSETAEIAVHSALTGHLVLSTLHTNDAPSTITRLVDLGIEPFLLASSLEGIIAQRLVRKICSDCKTSYHPDRDELKELGLQGNFTFYKGIGCENCMQTGYKGRVGIFEVLEFDEGLKKLIIKTQDANEIRHSAKQRGFTSMFEDGVKKIIKGITTSAEVLRATQMDENYV